MDCYIGVRLDEEDVKYMKMMKETTGCTSSWFVRKAIKEKIERDSGVMGGNKEIDTEGL